MITVPATAAGYSVRRHVPVPIAEQLAALNADWVAQRVSARRPAHDCDRLARAEAIRKLWLEALAACPSRSVPDLVALHPAIGRAALQHAAYMLVERGHIERVAGTGLPGHVARFALTAAGRAALAESVTSEVETHDAVC